MLKDTKDLRKPRAVPERSPARVLRQGRWGQARRWGGESAVATEGATARKGPGGGLWGWEGSGRVAPSAPDGAEQGVAGVVERVGGVEVADGVGGGVELVEGDAGFEEALGVVEGLELGRWGVITSRSW